MQSLTLDQMVNQVVQLGLKSIWVAKTKTTANSLLASTDWYVTRKSESDVAIPSTISTYRTAVRTASGTIETAINGCADLDAFKALFVVPLIVMVSLLVMHLFMIFQTRCKWLNQVSRNSCNFRKTYCCKR